MNLLRGDRQYTFTRALIAIIIANFVCLVLLNLLELRPFNLVYFYAAACLATYQASGYLAFGKRAPLDNVAVLTSVVMLVLLTVPRLTYLSDWLPGNEVRVFADDHARLAELVSLTLSERYPVLHPANRDYLLSFYYASLYPMALLKFVLPALTLKNAIFLGNLLYHVLVLGSLLEVAHLLLRNKAAVRMFIFLCTLFSGLDWLSDPYSNTTAFEWWQREFINGDVQISSFITGMFWVIHHFLAAYAILLAYVVFTSTRTHHRWLKTLLTLLLLVAAFYTSPFGVLAVPLFALVHAEMIWQRLVRTWTFAYVAVAAPVPLFIFAGRLPGQGFKLSVSHIAFTDLFWLDKILSAPIYLLIVPIVEFAAIPLLLLMVVKRMRPVERGYFAAAMSFFALTYVIAYSGWNNFAMRGMFLPTLVFFFLFAKYHATIFAQFTQRDVSWRITRFVTTLVLLLTIIGTLKTFSGLVNEALRSTLLIYQLPFTAAIYGSTPPAKLQEQYRHIVWDEQITSVQPSAADRHQDYKYNVEKFIDTLSLEEMAEWERELVRLPRRGLLR